MNITKSSTKDLYYTKDHEWINFQGSVAYAGVCPFKLIGFKEIQQINFSHPLGFMKEGDLIATIKYEDYAIEVHMPVDGKIMDINPAISMGELNILLQQTEGTAWLVLIGPSLPYDRKNLLLPIQYQMNGKSKFAKS